MLQLVINKYDSHGFVPTCNENNSRIHLQDKLNNYVA